MNSSVHMFDSNRSILPVLLFSILLAGLFTASGAHSQGLIIGPDGHPGGVTLEDHRVDARIEENVAVVTVEHVFHNPGRAAAEGTFLFPLPPGAQITRFAMDVDGREMAGELLSSEEARRIYEDIVRRSLDPALLEMVGHRSFRASVFPIPPGEERTIRLRYDAVLPKEGTTVSFHYPLQGSVQTNRTARIMPVEQPIGPRRPNSSGEGPSSSGTSLQSHDDDEALTRIRIELASAAPIANIYSPSHAVNTERSSGGRAVVQYEAPVEDDRDFVVYFGLDDREVGATLLTHRPYGDRPGYFMLMLSPQANADGQRIQSKDVVFVLDTSGSMAGEKIEQAREALRYCLNRLSDNDRFGLVAFSSDADRFRDDLVSAGTRSDAQYFVDQLEAGGGTNIHDALLDAAELLAESEQGMIIFLTDGLPSVGIEDEGQIRRAVRDALPDGARLFSFGVGYDVNTQLLDGLSRETGVPADYISPDENIEERIAAFYDKISYPLLTDLSFDLDGADAYAFAPGSLHNLYKGGQIILTGRYRRPGSAEFVLTGTRDSRQERFTYTLDFPERERDRPFVARLWATRRVGQLLEEIRLDGENEELKDEIVALAKEFGLVTPYTSYLVEEEESLAQNVRRNGSGGGQMDGIAADAPAAEMMAAGAPAFKSREASGARAVAASRAIRAMTSAETAPSESRGPVTSVNGRTMIFRDGWIDEEYTEADLIVEIKMGSDAYFALLRAYPDALPFARLGEAVTFKLGEGYLRIGDSGLADATEAELRSLIG